MLLYARASSAGLRFEESRSRRPIAVLGAEPFLSLWAVLSIENSAHGTPVLTLKSQRSFGTLPDLDSTRVPMEIKTELGSALEKVEDGSHRQGAVEVIDRCRDALSVVFGHACGEQSLDLAQAINKSQGARKHAEPRDWAGQIVARLHSRAKPNEQAKREIRSVTEDDAYLALSCLGVVLREFGWAKSE